MKSNEKNKIAIAQLKAKKELLEKKDRGALEQLLVKKHLAFAAAKKAKADL